MSRYTISDTQAKLSKKIIKKIGFFPVSDKNLIGSIKLTGIRKYAYSWEVDAEFIGEAYFRVGREGKFQKSKILKIKNISKIKVNRILRKYLHQHIDRRLRYFGAELRWYSDIKKIKWT